MKKIALVLVAISVVLAAIYKLAGPSVSSRVMHKVLVKNLSGANFDFEHGLHVVLCGAGSALPDPDRSGPCVLVIAGEQVLVFDAGSGSARNIPVYGIPAASIRDVFITHFHSDHIDGLGELKTLTWAGSGRDEPITVHGPRGLGQVVAGISQAYFQDSEYRVKHHGEDTVKPSAARMKTRQFRLPVGDEGLLVFDSAGLQVTAFNVDHEPVVPAIGYRVDYAGRSVVISGDTSKSANVEKFATGADLLVHEALSRPLVSQMKAAAEEAGNAVMVKIFSDIPDYHTDPVEAAEIAAAAGVGHLLFYHIVPALPLPPLETIFLEGVADAYDGGVTLGRDGSWIALPADSSEIRAGRRGLR